ncbi:MAG: aminoacyl-tRNA hydrolase [Defluviitaleaceae bacterium]|nr:aminoacyl-tRNA hydrolase [Defluviitaleaceae bacterium]
MFLIVGLGNPGKQYAATRHNMGFEVVDKLAYDNDVKMKASKFDAYSGETFINGHKVVFVKPTTYMNLSGRAVRDFVRFFKMPVEDLKERLIVVYDDTDLATGKIRIRQRGSAGGHNGIKDILYQLETDEFIRVRVGVGKRPEGWKQADYVLSRFGKDEEDEAVQGILTAVRAVDDIIRNGVSFAMNKHNPSEKPPKQAKKQVENEEIGQNGVFETPRAD